MRARGTFWFIAASSGLHFCILSSLEALQGLTDDIPKERRVGCVLVPSHTAVPGWLVLSGRSLHLVSVLYPCHLSCHTSQVIDATYRTKYCKSTSDILFCHMCCWFVDGRWKRMESVARLSACVYPSPRPGVEVYPLICASFGFNVLSLTGSGCATVRWLRTQSSASRLSQRVIPRHRLGAVSCPWDKWQSWVTRGETCRLLTTVIYLG
ncbi:hypothetical protein VTK56DRAFT_3304 [Thermocarpiscus australiensis]